MVTTTSYLPFTLFLLHLKTTEGLAHLGFQQHTHVVSVHRLTTPFSEGIPTFTVHG